MTDFVKEEELTKDEELEAQQRLANKGYWYKCSNCNFESHSYLDYYHHKTSTKHVVMIMSYDTEKVFELLSNAMIFFPVHVGKCLSNLGEALYDKTDLIYKSGPVREHREG